VVRARRAVLDRSSVEPKLGEAPADQRRGDLAGDALAPVVEVYDVGDLAGPTSG
jgi:hypothetical protein